MADPHNAAHRPPPGTPDSRLRRLQQRFREEVWHRPLVTIPRSRRWAVSALRMGAIVGGDFTRNQGSLQASALTFIALMSLVPVLAVMFAVSKGFGAHERLMAMVNDNLARLPPAAGEVATRIFEAVDRTNFGSLGAIGVLLLFWSVVSVMGQIESTFNQIWRVRTPRTLVRRFQCYISILVVVPVLFLAATTLNTLLSSARVAALLQRHFGPLYELYTRGLGLLGLVAIIAGFTLLYLFMPNTRVRWTAALTGACVAGILWTLLQWSFIASQMWVTKYNAIYGTFAAIPIFLFWLQLNWYVVIAGAELSFAVQNRDNLELVFDVVPLSFGDRERIALVLLEEVCAASYAGTGPCAGRDMAQRHALPLPIVEELLRLLERHGLVAEVTSAPGAYLPARDLHLLSPADVVQALREECSAAERLFRLPVTTAAQHAYEQRFGAYAEALGRITFQELARQGTPEPAAPAATKGHA